MHNEKIKKIAPIIIGLGISGLILVLGFKFLQGGFARANDIAPTGGTVQISEISADSAKVSWQTSVATQCVIQYNTSITGVESGSFFPETDKTTNHAITLTLLAESTDYYFNLKCEDKLFDNSGVPFTFKTKSKKEAANEKSGQATITIPPEQVSITPPLPTPTTATESSNNGTCSYTNCETILQNIGKGCTYGQYLQCQNQASPTPTLIRAPTATPTP